MHLHQRSDKVHGGSFVVALDAYHKIDGPGSKTLHIILFSHPLFPLCALVKYSVCIQYVYCISLRSKTFREIFSNCIFWTFCIVYIHLYW